MPPCNVDNHFWDPNSGETAAERWNPTQSVESILLSVVSLLNDPNCSSPANVDAGVMYRNSRDEYNKIIKSQVEASKKNIPEDLVMITDGNVCSRRVFF
jgi:ubiquitin-conjugating enzyme E2 R